MGDLQECAIPYAIATLHMVLKGVQPRFCGLREVVPSLGLSFQSANLKNILGVNKARASVGACCRRAQAGVPLFIVRTSVTPRS